jgi:sulfur carrier protein
MIVVINAQPTELPDGATVADAVARATADQPANTPFAVAVNLQFVPRAHYPHTPLHDGDRVEIIAPVTGG